MPRIWNRDDLLFALVRAASLEPAVQVADDLLAAADEPAARLREVTPLAARVRAARVLLRAGQPDRSLAMLRQAVQAAGPDPDGRALLDGADAFAEAGEPAEAEDLVNRVLRADPDGGHSMMGGLLQVVFTLTEHDHFDQALRVTDAMAASLSGLTHQADWRGQLSTRALKIVALTRKQVLDLRQERLTTRASPAGPADGSAPGGPPWPSLATGCLLWWPEAEYRRIIRQVPELGGVLGERWREHTARVESAMQSHAAPGGAAAAGKDIRNAGLSLLAAQYEQFTRYLERTGADPRLAAVMTAYTADTAGGTRAPWPPGPGDPCWCGSRKRYQRCCAARRGTAPARRRLFARPSA